MAKKMNPKALQALVNYRKAIADGTRSAPRRKSTAERLDEKKLKLAKLLKQVDELKTEIARLDAAVNKKEKAEIVKGYTAEELAEAIRLYRARG